MSSTQPELSLLFLVFSSQRDAHGDLPEALVEERSRHLISIFQVDDFENCAPLSFMLIGCPELEL